MFIFLLLAIAVLWYLFGFVATVFLNVLFLFLFYAFYISSIWRSTTDPGQLGDLVLGTMGIAALLFGGFAYFGLRRLTDLQLRHRRQMNARRDWWHTRSDSLPPEA
ncbi:MAG: hypothetical protein M0T84_01690 [Betaproteobacteria bacterium]|nr:hypothetical protein [Betaproteobacteria bacterium]